MKPYITVLNKPQNYNYFWDILSKHNDEKNKYCIIIVESEEEALEIANRPCRISYYSDVDVVYESLEFGGEYFCTTNDTFLEVIQELVEKINLGTSSIFYSGCNDRLILNDKLPWLEYLPDGKVKFGVDPEFLKVYKDYVIVLADNYEGSDLQKYCNLNGFEVRFEESI